MNYFSKKLELISRLDNNLTKWHMYLEKSHASVKLKIKTDNRRIILVWPWVNVKQLSHVSDAQKRNEYLFFCYSLFIFNITLPNVCKSWKKLINVVTCLCLWQKNLHVKCVDMAKRKKMSAVSWICFIWPRNKNASFIYCI